MVSTAPISRRLELDLLNSLRLLEDDDSFGDREDVTDFDFVGEIDLDAAKSWLFLDGVGDREA